MNGDMAKLYEKSLTMTAKQRFALAAAMVRGVNGQTTPLHAILDRSGRRCWPRVGGYDRDCRRMDEERNDIHQKLQPFRGSTAAWIVAVSSPGLRRLSAHVGHPLHMITVVDTPDQRLLDDLAKAHFWCGAGQWVSDLQRTADAWNFEILDESTHAATRMVDWVTIEQQGIRVDLPQGMSRVILHRHVRARLALCSLGAWQNREGAEAVRDAPKMDKFNDLVFDPEGSRWELLQDLTLIDIDDGMPRLAYLVEEVLLSYAEGRL